MNAYKDGTRSAEIRDIARQIADWKRTLSQLVKFDLEY